MTCNPIYGPQPGATSRCTSFSHQIFFRIKAITFCFIGGFFRNTYWRLQGMKIGPRTILPAIKANWPHQVSLGGNCVVEHGVTFKCDGIWSRGPRIVFGEDCFVGAGSEFNIRIGVRFGAACLIGAGCRFIDHDHGTDGDGLIRNLPGMESEIIVGDNVWFGVNAVVLKGVVIGSGAVIGAGAVVTKSVPENEIWGGVPASRIRSRKTASSSSIDL